MSLTTSPCRIHLKPPVMHPWSPPPSYFHLPPCLMPLSPLRPLTGGTMCMLWFHIDIQEWEGMRHGSAPWFALESALPLYSEPSCVIAVLTFLSIVEGAWSLGRGGMSGDLVPVVLSSTGERGLGAGEKRA